MKRIRKILIVVFLTLLVLVTLLLTVPFIFKDKISQELKAVANQRLKTELNFSEINVSFFRHFPRLTFGLKDFSLKSSAPFEKDTLISANEVAFGVDVLSLFSKTIIISRIYLDKANVEVRYDEKGAANFMVYNSSESIKVKDTISTGMADINIEHITFSNSRFVYADPSIPVSVELKGLNYSGKCNLTRDILSLTSKIRINTVDFILNKTPYLREKPLEAQLTTIINTRTLNIKFEKNDIRIKDMPVNFNGRFTFQKGGYLLVLRLLSIYENEIFSASLQLKSTDHLYIKARANTVMNIAKWSQAIGFKDVSLRGLFTMNFNAEGIYETATESYGKELRTVIRRIPMFTLFSSITDGYLKYKKLPQAITNISFDLNVSAPDENYRHIRVKLEKLNAQFFKNHIEGYFHVNGLDDFPVEGKLSTQVNLAELKRVIPLDSLDLQGKLDLDLTVKGKYSPEKKYFPVSEIKLSLKEGRIQTKYYPHPLENINIESVVTNGTGQLRDTRINISPFSFLFEGNPFEINAAIENPESVDYSINAKGIVDVARVYKIFSKEGMKLDGCIESDLSLHGTQRDALAGRYEKLQNKGRLVLKNIGFTSGYLPKQLILNNGVFRFDNDKIWFEKFRAKYGASDINLDGHLSNMINYLLSKNQVLKGKFNLNSDRLLVDEFIFKTDDTHSGTNVSAGVIIIPDNLDIGFSAKIKKVLFQGITLTDFLTAVSVRKGILVLNGMQFDFIGTKVAMEANYGSINPSKAFFDFHVSAKDFDVKRAYNELELFRNLASAAGKADGIISLDYSLKGSLGPGMFPIYPSLEGGGVLSLKKVKVKGLKLFTVVGKSTEREKLKNPDISKVDLKTTIHNNVITLEQTKMKISSFRLKISGTTNFNGQLNLKMRIGLPPLGIFGIPLRILGTSDNPKLKYGRGNLSETVEETEYTDEMPADLKEKIRNVKEEDSKEDVK
ncbi:MAG: AsmA-like C-terminal region-containing protein [Bacteroidales bacterium]|nr:AsmA-like C-terminal region-containing protein [Bacteroidales bacterium]